MARRITDDKIEEINRVYNEIGTYAGTARIVGVSASTVKKYIIDGFLSENLPTFQELLPEIDFDKVVSTMSTYVPKEEDFELTLSQKEKEQIKKLWGGMNI